MRTTSTFSILFWVYSTRADQNNESPIYARISLNGKRVGLSLKQKVNLDLWDATRQRAKGNNMRARHINNYLDDVRADVVQCKRDLEREDRILSAELIKLRYLGEDKKVHSLLDIFEFHNKKMKSKLAPKTLCHYRTSQKYILAFVQSEFSKPDRFLKQLDHKFVISFEHFLREYSPEPYQGKIGNNAVMKHIQRLRKMVTLAYDMEWIDRDPFVRFKPHMEREEREFLTEKKLKDIVDLEINIERLALVRDVFVFSCYTGISYADIAQLDNQSVSFNDDGSKWLTGKRNKTGVQFKIPLLPLAESIIQKYAYHPRTQFSKKLVPIISNQKLNSYLKEIADQCGISKNLTFHMARHTFATTVTLTNGVPIETVSKLLGHRSLKTTQIYAKIIEKKVQEDMDILKKKLNNKK